MCHVIPLSLRSRYHKQETSLSSNSPAEAKQGKAKQCVLYVQLVPRYQNLLHGAELVESQLKDSFPEYLNAEIALRTIPDVSVAISWLKGSFFYIRVCCCVCYKAA